MTLYLGIDGGGTGCRAAVADASGRILGRASGGPANIASQPELAQANILTAATEALAAAVGPEKVKAELPRLVAAMGLAGANIPACAARLAGGLPFAATRIETDAFTAVKGAIHEADGIVAAIGTGSVFAAQSAGKIRHIGGWGFVLGDEGSGAWLGRALLAQCLRAADGFVAMTPLLQSTTENMGGRNGIVSFAFTAQPGDFAALAPAIAQSDDPAALALMSMAEVEISMAIALLQGKAPVPVTYLGGLGDCFALRLAGQWQVRPALGTGLDGALWLARQVAA